MVRGKLEAVILPSAALIGPRKSFQGTICSSIGKCCSVKSARLQTWVFTAPESCSKSKPFPLTKIKI